MVEVSKDEGEICFRTGSIMFPSEFYLSDVIDFRSKGTIQQGGLLFESDGNGRITMQPGNETIVYRPRKGKSFFVQEALVFEWWPQTGDIQATAESLVKGAA